MGILINFVFFFVLHLVQGKIVRHTFEIKYTGGAYDGVWKDKVLTINGQFPGPTIRAKVRDTLQINVINSIQDGQNTSIHWHGIHQKGTPFEDGPSMITQCPLKTGGTQRYRFKVENAGTFWYHSHVASQYSEGLWGVLIVDNKKREVYSYDGEFTIALSDWYYQTARENEEWYSSPNFGGFPPYPDSLMINGRGAYPCNIALGLGRKCNPSLQTRPVFNLRSKKSYRVRVVNTSSRSSFNFSIDGHSLIPIEVDGVDIDNGQSAIANVAFISPGQRYSFLLRRNELFLAPKRYTIRAVVDDLPVNQTNNINPNINALIKEVNAVLNYRLRSKRQIEEDEMEKVEDQMEKVEETFELISDPLSEELSNSKSTKATILLNESLLRPYDRIMAPANFDIEFILLSNLTNQRLLFNSSPFKIPQDKPLILSILDNQKPPKEVNPLVIPKLGSVVQIVINNEIADHPLHLHGHTFWVVGKGKGLYDRKNQDHKLNLKGVRRDTVYVLANSWLVIRFIADNPGVWLFHCHIDWHNLSGMSVSIIEAPHTLSVPNETKRVCAS